MGFRAADEEGGALEGVGGGVFEGEVGHEGEGAGEGGEGDAEFGGFLVVVVVIWGGRGRGRGGFGRGEEVGEEELADLGGLRGKVVRLDRKGEKRGGGESGEKTHTGSYFCKMLSASFL